MISACASCGHYPVMHAGGIGKCNHGSHSPKTKTKPAETGCACVAFTAAPVVEHA